MKLALYLLTLLAIVACAHNIPQPAPAQAAAAATIPATPVVVEPAPVARQCKRIDQAWLKRQAPAEGSVVIVFEVSKARRRQVEKQNEQLASLEAAFIKHGCLELP